MQFDARFLGLMLLGSLLVGAFAGAGLAAATRTASVDATECVSTIREGVMTERLRPESFIVADVVR